MIFEKLKELIIKHTDCKPEMIQKDTLFIDLGIDSLDTVEMIMELEEELGVELDFDEKVSTIGEMVKFIENRMKELKK